MHKESCNGIQTIIIWETEVKEKNTSFLLKFC